MTSRPLFFVRVKREWCCGNTLLYKGESMSESFRHAFSKSIPKAIGESNEGANAVRKSQPSLHVKLSTTKRQMMDATFEAFSMRSNRAGSSLFEF